mmetsp:Transcript_43128/g.105479  ORF Transcript_43128/g.105479 Transcript_43128/m.105479 type:complete len:299 (-) Transcript_43128:529-1425(-)|eukprot:CAMPEP_0206241236 /NCGR_PEP_ID=MMETSP0047_2-20121206/16386_1 /ASSEMBLY_ACC=CAM_ASM_000192 /TAXON_ID=195065 /ORGANISM="Chroomonas mesostigmatica_cf, Strain CCMP1168" /LENGTH=298 /DNA_ID=CAMNT_0053666115 /DNA_START=88 /DNA_END=984 /DNA_ORIENTATION=-
MGGKANGAGKAAKPKAQDKKPSVFHTILLIVCLILWCPLTGIPGMLAILFAPIFGLSACQTFTWRCSVVFFKIVLWAAGCSYTVLGLENLDPEEHYFFASNHESHFDVPLIFSTLPFWLISIAKKSLMYIPFFGWAVAAGGTVWIDRKNTGKAINSMSSAEVALRKRPRSVLIFPEGTRTTDGKLQPFKKGGLILAIQTGMPIVPVCVSGTRSVCVKGGRCVTPRDLAIIYGKPISTKGLTYDDRDTLCADVEAAVAKLQVTVDKLAASKKNTKVEPFWHCFLGTPPPGEKGWGRLNA